MSAKQPKLKKMERQSGNNRAALRANAEAATYASEFQRLTTFVSFPNVVSSVLLAKEGFIYTGVEDQTLCVFCGEVWSDWRKDDDVHEVHAAMSPTCPMISGVDQNKGNHASRKDELKTQNSKEVGLLPLKTLSEESAVTNLTPALNKPKKCDRSSDVLEHAKRAEYTTLSKRLESFATWPKEHHLERSYLAQAGLFYTGDQDCVRCYYCGGGLRSWKLGDNVWVEHARWFPKCTFIQGAVGCDFVAAVSELNKSHDQISLSLVSQRLINGYVNNYPALNCEKPTVQKQQIHSNKETIQAPHANESECTKDISSSNESAKGANSEVGLDPDISSHLGVITEKPKKGELALKPNRLRTFEKWPEEHHLKPEMLAEAGYYYAGYGDCCRCFYCGGGLRNWDVQDDVWVEHARWFPCCAYVKQMAGMVFIDAVQELNKTHDKITLEMLIAKIGYDNLIFHKDPRLAHISLMKEPAVTSVVEAGYKEEDVITEAQHLREKKDKLTVQALIESLNAKGKTRLFKTHFEESSNCSLEVLEAIKKENNELRDQTLCKICWDKNVEVLFTPCGHLLSCTECAVTLKSCPICRFEIKGKARVILS